MEFGQIVRDFQSGGFHDLRVLIEPAGHGPWHYYPNDRVFLVLDGALEIVSQQGRQRAEVGSYLYLPAGRFHQRHIHAPQCRYLIATRVW